MDIFLKMQFLLVEFQITESRVDLLTFHFGKESYTNQLYMKVTWDCFSIRICHDEVSSKPSTPHTETLCVYIYTILFHTWRQS